MNERIQIANRANIVADELSRGLLVYLLPEEPPNFYRRSPSLNGKYELLKMIESGIATISDLSQLTENYRGLIEERERRKQAPEDEKNALIGRARNMFQRLDFEYLIPYYLDYKRRGPEYAVKKWSEKLPIIKVPVTITPIDQSEPKIVPIPTPARIVEEKDNEEKNSYSSTYS